MSCSRKICLSSLAVAGLLLGGSRISFAQAAGEEFPGDEETTEAELITIGESTAEDTGPLVDYRTEDLDRDYVEPPSDRETTEEELRQSFVLYRESLRNSSLDEADTLAKRIIEYSIELYGLDSYDSARALTNLGIVQHRARDFESAQLNYQAAIDIVERIGDRLNSELINPLTGLGTAQLASGRPDLARSSFSRAVHISHVNEGPHNLMQVDILDALAETYLSAGEIDEALDIQESIYNLQTRKIDLKSEDVLAALQRQAEWMHRLQYYSRERVAYRQMIRVIERTRGKKDLSLIPPLTGLGNSYLFIEPYDSEFQSYQPASGGEVYLKRALRLAEDNEESDWRMVRDALLVLGDFYTLAANPNRSRRTYKEVWELLSAEEARLPDIRSTLQSTIVLQEIAPPKYYNSERTDDGRHAPDSFNSGNIVVGYIISEYGHPTKISIIEAQPPGLEDMERAVARSVRDLRYRPQLEDGDVVRIHDVTYTHEFYYRESDLPGHSTDSELIVEQPEQ